MFLFSYFRKLFYVCFMLNQVKKVEMGAAKSNGKLMKRIDVADQCCSKLAQQLYRGKLAQKAKLS